MITMPFPKGMPKEIQSCIEKIKKKEGDRYTSEQRAKICWASFKKTHHKDKDGNWVKGMIEKPYEIEVRGFVEDLDGLIDVEGKKLTYQERLKLPKSTYCYIHVEKLKTKAIERRDFPVPDLAHVRNAFARLHFAPADKRNAIHDCVLRKAKKLGWGKDEIERHKKKCRYCGGAKGIESEKAKLYLEGISIETIGENESLIKIRPAKDGSKVYSYSGIAFRLTPEALEKYSQTWKGGTVSINHIDTKLIGEIIESDYIKPFVEMITDINLDKEALIKVKGGKEAGLEGLSVELDVKEYDDKLDVREFDGTGVTYVFYPDEPSCTPDDGCVVVGTKIEDNEEISEGETMENEEETAKTYNVSFEEDRKRFIIVDTDGVESVAVCIKEHERLFGEKDEEIKKLTDEKDELVKYKDEILAKEREDLLGKLSGSKPEDEKYKEIGEKYKDFTNEQLKLVIVEIENKEKTTSGAEMGKTEEEMEEERIRKHARETREKYDMRKRVQGLKEEK